MLRVRDIMTTDVLVLEPEISIRDAMASLTTRPVSGAPVVAAERVVGVVTATDLLDFASALPGVPTASDESPQQGENATTDEWVEGEEPPGTFFHEMWDDTGADVATRMADVKGPEWDVLSEHVVAEAMNHVVKAISPDTPVDEAADYMRDASIHRALVMDDEKLVGIVSTSDIVGAVADHKVSER